jgi:hypothetical protein
VPLYPQQRWHEYIPVVGDRNLESTRLVAQRLKGVTKVWVVLSWGGFETLAEDASPIRTTLDQSFFPVMTRDFGGSLRVRLFNRKTKPSVAASRENAADQPAAQR